MLSCDCIRADQTTLVSRSNPTPTFRLPPSEDAPVLDSLFYDSSRAGQG